MHATTQIASQDIPNNQGKSGEGSFHDTKEKHNESSEDELAMKDRGRKEGKKERTRRDLQLLDLIMECGSRKLVHVLDATNLDIKCETAQNK